MRKLSWIIAGILCSAPVFVHAAELGNAKIDSHLTERLNVKIPIYGLNGVPLDEVKVRLAPEKYYQQAGLSLDGLSGNITFQIASKGKKNFVIVRSKRPISNPILSMLVQISAGDGAQIKEFDLLLDPPVHAKRNAGAIARRSMTGHEMAPTTNSRAVQPGASWAPVANVPSVKMGGTYKVTRGDTLYDIAKKAAEGTSIPVRPMMQAIINANSNAFINGNGNLMKAGATLKVPERVVTPSASSSGSKAGKTSEPTSSKASSVSKGVLKGSETKPKLQLLGVDSSQTKPANSSTESSSTMPENGSGGRLGGVLPAIDSPSSPQAQAQASTVQQNNEAIASIDAKSEVMSKQIAMLNDQLKQVQGLITERNESIEQLQQKVKQAKLQAEQLKKQLEAQNDNFWVRWAPYLLGAAGLMIILLLLIALTRGRKREVVETTLYPVTAGTPVTTTAQAKDTKEELHVPDVTEREAPVTPSVAPGVDAKSVIDEARLLLSYNLNTQAYELIEDTIAKQPNELSLYQELARMYAEANNTAELEKVLARIDDKFGADKRPNTEELEVYTPSSLEMDSDASSEPQTPEVASTSSDFDELNRIPDSAFTFDTDLNSPNETAVETAGEAASQTTSEATSETIGDSEPALETSAPGLSLASGDELTLDEVDQTPTAAVPDTHDLELQDLNSDISENATEAQTAEAHTEAEHDTGTVADTSVQDDTRLGLAEAFLGVGDQESYQMIADEIEAEGNPALIAALKEIKQKFA